MPSNCLWKKSNELPVISSIDVIVVDAVVEEEEVAELLEEEHVEKDEDQEVQGHKQQIVSVVFGLEMALALTRVSLILQRQGAGLNALVLVRERVAQPVLYRHQEHALHRGREEDKASDRGLVCGERGKERKRAGSVVANARSGNK